MNGEQTQLGTQPNERKDPAPAAVVDQATAAVQPGDVVLPGAIMKPEPEVIEKVDLVNTIPARAFQLDATAIRVIRELKCNKANDLEVAHFLYICHALGLNPLLPGQISFAAYSKDDGEEGDERRRVVMIEIGGLRNLAARTGRYRQGDPPVLEWPEKSDHPAACTVSLYERVDGQWVRHERRFLWEEFSQFHRRKMWKTNPAAMFPKTCESAMIRFYFFDGTAGIYTPEEIEAPDISAILDHAPPVAPAKPPLQARILDLLRRASRRLKEMGDASPKDATASLAAQTNPGHQSSATWGEAECDKFAAAVEKLEVTPVEKKT